jgi:hypothetical protein
VLVLISTRAAAGDLPIQIPYTGFLQNHGMPFNGSVAVQVTLTATDATGTQTAWTETHPTVMVASGRFNIILGSITPIAPTFVATALASGTPLTLSVAVNGTQLMGTQTIYPSAFASASTAAKSSPSDFQVNGALTFQDIIRNVISWIFPGDAPNGIAYRPAGAPDALTISGAGTAVGMRLIRLFDNINVGGSITSGGDITTSGKVVAGGGVAPAVDTGFFPVYSDPNHSNPAVPVTAMPPLPSPSIPSIYRDPTNTTTVVIWHNLGFIPSQLMIQGCGALNVNGGACTTPVTLLGTTGYHDSGSTVNPNIVYSDPNKIYLGIVSSWWIWGYWNGTAWGCMGDALDPNCFAGYYRVLAWR